MDEVTQAKRLAEDEPLFKKPTDDPTIIPDSVSPAIEGYFRIPPVWIGKEPEPASLESFNPQICHEIVLNMQLNCGIEACVQRDGTFLFDFSSWSLAPSVVIPGYRIPNIESAYRPPKENISAENQAEAFAILRAQVMNVHQAFLATSEHVVRRRGAGMGFPVTSWNTHKAIYFGPPHYADDSEDVRALARNVINNVNRASETQSIPRRVLELDVVEHSLQSLDQLLIARDKVLIQMIETAYLAACRCSEKRFGEAITLAWGVCEQLISSAWNTLLDDVQSGRMPKKRKKVLNGRDYTASVVTEILELNGIIDHELYLLLNEARKFRNKWAHQLTEPDESDVHKAIRATENLLFQIKGVKLFLQAGGRGGVPAWNIWIWEQVRGPIES